jgi:hypothetical protein
LAGIKNKPEYERLEMRRFIERHGITRFRHKSLLPGEHADADAERRGGALAGRVRTLRRRDVPPQCGPIPSKMDDPAVLAATLAESGFDGEKILALAQTREVKDELLANATRSVERGAFGSPTSSATRSSSARTGCATSRSGFSSCASVRAQSRSGPRFITTRSDDSLPSSSKR